MYGFESHKWTALHRLFMHRRSMIYMLFVLSGALWFGGVPFLAASSLFIFGIIVVFAIHGSLFESIDRPGDYLIPTYGYGSRRYQAELRRQEEEAKRITPERNVFDTHG